MREATEQERAKETALIYASLGDVGIVTLLTIAAATTASLTMLGEAVRGMFTLLIQGYSLWVLFAVHRDRLTRFEYGVGKIEQFVSALVGFGLLISGLWLAQVAIGTVFGAQPAASPLGLTMAAITNAINTVINTSGWVAMVAASRQDDSEVYRAQLRARFTMMVTSLTLQVTLTIAALAKDDAIALFLDVVGVAFVIGIMVHGGVSMLSRALPHLLDAPAAADLRDLIRAAVAGVVAEKDIVSVRTRRAGPTTFAEVAVAASAFPSIAALRDATAQVRTALGDRAAGVDIAIVLAP